MRVDTTVVETNIHYPTDSSLLGDGVRVLTRTMKKITKIAGAAGTQLRDRSRSVQLKVLEIARAARAKGGQSQEKLKSAYSRLLHATSRVVGQAKRFAEEIIAGIKRSRTTLKQMALEGLRKELVLRREVASARSSPVAIAQPTLLIAAQCKAPAALPLPWIDCIAHVACFSG